MAVGVAATATTEEVAEMATEEVAGEVVMAMGVAATVGVTAAVAPMGELAAASAVSAERVVAMVALVAVVAACTRCPSTQTPRRNHIPCHSRRSPHLPRTGACPALCTQPLPLCMWPCRRINGIGSP